VPAGAGLALASSPALAFSKPNNKERTYIMIKVGATPLRRLAPLSLTDRVLVQPDGVQRGLIGSIITRFEQKGYKLVALKMASPTKSHLECASPFSPSGSAEGRAPGWMLTARRAQEALR